MEESILLPYSIFMIMLSFVILNIVGFKPFMKLFIVVYLVIVEIATWKWGSKWLLIGSIGFILLSMSYTRWALYEKYKSIRDDENEDDDDAVR